MKKLPIEERKISTTFALSLTALKRLDEIQKNNYPGKSRSFVMDKIIETVFKARIFDQERTEEFPDDVSEIGYNPFTGSYEEDPTEGTVKQKLSSIYGEVHNAEQTNQV